MPGRLPTTSDFPKSVTLSITSPPASQPCTNILILLHGLGDTNQSFKALGQNLNLPETACLSLQAPTPLPFDLSGFHWGDDIIFDEGSGSMDLDTGFKRSAKLLLEDIIREGLIKICGFQAREIVLFGFGQGGIVALNAASEMADEELGGVVSVGGPLPSAIAVPDMRKKFRTPVLVCKANTGSGVSEEAAGKIKDSFAFAEVKEWSKKGDSMPSNRDEMMPIMRFFARRLRSRRGVPSGAVEIT